MRRIFSFLLFFLKWVKNNLLFRVKKGIMYLSFESCGHLHYLIIHYFFDKIKE